MQARPGSSRLHRTCGIVARLGLILSLWHAPIPWLHHHGTNVAETSSPLLAAEFRDHLYSFHRTAELNSGEEFGWHCHWLLPSWIDFQDDVSGDGGRPLEDVSAFDSVIPLPVLSCPFEPRLLAAPTMAGIARRRELIELAARSFSQPTEPFLRPNPSAAMRC